MSAELQNGLHTELPPAAQEHVDQLHPDLQQAMGSQLLRLSHADFHKNANAEVVFGSQEPASTEVGEYGPQVDRVGHYITEASAALHAAHDRLTEAGQAEGVISAEGLAVAAHRQLVEQAADKKRDGDTEAAISSLETALIIQSLTPHNDYDKGQDVFVHTAVSQNLATELVRATKNTFGVVSVPPAGSGRFTAVTPVSRCSQRSSALLKVASAEDFSDDFSDTQPFLDEAHTRETADLSQDDLLSLTRAAVGRHSPEEAKAFATKALEVTEKRTEDPDALAALLIQAEELKVDDLDTRLTRLRAERRVGDSYVSMMDLTPKTIQRAIPRLVHAGHEELAYDLISSHRGELWGSKDAVHDWLGVDTPEAERIVKTIENLHTRKQEALTVTLQAHGASQEVIDDMVAYSEAVDPDQAAAVSSDFWPRYESLDSEARHALLKGDGAMEDRASALVVLESRGFHEDVPQVVDALARLEGSEAQTQFVASLETAWKEVNDAADESTKEYTTLGRKHVLLQFEDPSHALQIARQVFGEEYLDDVGKILSICRDNSDVLVAIPSGLAEQLVEFRGQVGDELFNKAIQQAPYSQGNNQEYLTSFMRATEQVGDFLGDPGIRSALLNRADPLDVAKDVLGTRARLEAYGLTLSEIQALPLTTLKHSLDRKEEEGGLTEYIRELRFEAEMRAGFGKAWEARIESWNARKKAAENGEESEANTPEVARKSELTDFKVFESYLSKLGLGHERAFSMFASWNTKRPLENEIYDLELGMERDSQLAENVTQHVEAIVQEARPLASFVEAYGAQETLAIIDTFGIHHFTRYDARQLHQQLLVWRKGDVSPKNIVVSAHSDHNTAFRATGKNSAEQLGRKRTYKNKHEEATRYTANGLFFFEASAKADIAKVALAVGQRERQNGRDPRHGRLENFIIQAHGSPEGMDLGPYSGQELNADDYVKARQGRYSLNQDAYPRTRVQANTFSQHLGDNFRIVLSSCSAGALGGVGQAMSGGHGRHLVGAAEVISTMTIEPNGKVTYEHGGADVLAMQYNQGVVEQE
ncbi:MAG TPA: hypothetical protein VK694_03510 [Verrucomicrobiae bacterium]|nr:hypothetical protein [Verrucomicrobiae bacterium]